MVCFGAYICRTLYVCGYTQYAVSSLLAGGWRLAPPYVDRVPIDAGYIPIYVRLQYSACVRCTVESFTDCCVHYARQYIPSARVFLVFQTFAIPASCVGCPVCLRFSPSHLAFAVCALSFLLLRSRPTALITPGTSPRKALSLIRRIASCLQTANESWNPPIFRPPFAAR